MPRNELSDALCCLASSSWLCHGGLAFVSDTIADAGALVTRWGAHVWRRVGAPAGCDRLSYKLATQRPVAGVELREPPE